MSEAKPTPGPWYVPEYAPWQIVDSRSNANWHLPLPGYTALAVTHDDKRRGRTKEQSEANARLIAAAPELYEAAIAVREFFDAPEIDDKLYTAAARKVGEAIAKAEGRS